jgi:deoxyxylulose-5-phosphate synthase
MSILSGIERPKDLKGLSHEQLAQLAQSVAT